MSIQYLTLRELQQVYFELLQEFDQICRENDLRYDLCGGSMLGAVRHQGYIPWDDDADVSLPRPAYEELKKRYLNGTLKLPAHRDLVMEDNHTFPRHFMRYIRYDVKRDAAYAEEDDCPYIGLDIFTVDGLPSDEKECQRHLEKIQKYRRMLVLAQSKPGTSSRGKLVALAKDLVRPVLKAYGSYRLVNTLENLCKKYDYDTAEYVGIANGMYGMKERWLKKDMEPQIMFKFESGEFPGYLNYDIYLSNLYGNYMELPPEEKQIPHCDPAYFIEPEK